MASIVPLELKNKPFLRITSKEEDCMLELAWDEVDNKVENSYRVSVKHNSNHYMHEHYCDTKEGLTTRQKLEGFQDKVYEALGNNNDEFFITNLDKYTSKYLGQPDADNCVRVVSDIKFDEIDAIKSVENRYSLPVKGIEFIQKFAHRLKR